MARRTWFHRLAEDPTETSTEGSRPTAGELDTLSGCSVTLKLPLLRPKVGCVHASARPAVVPDSTAPLAATVVLVVYKLQMGLQADTSLLPVMAWGDDLITRHKHADKGCPRVCSPSSNLMPQGPPN